MKMKVLFMALLLSLSATVIHGATYNYGSSITSKGKIASAYTQASNDYCRVTSTATYVIDGKYLKTINDGADRDPNTGYATLTIKLPNSGLYFSRIDSKHTVGKNTYNSYYTFEP